MNWNFVAGLSHILLDRVLDLYRLYALLGFSLYTGFRQLVALSICTIYLARCIVVRGKTLARKALGAVFWLLLAHIRCQRLYQVIVLKKPAIGGGLLL